MAVKTNRFSKQLVAERLAREIEGSKFDLRNGWNQVAGKGEELNRAYGEFKAAVRMIDEFDLWPLVNSILANRNSRTKETP